MDDKRLRIAILGGGLAGAAALRGLSRHAHLSVSIFESAAAFREPGQGIGFNANAIWALELLGLKTCLDAAGAVRINTTRLQLGHGAHAGTHLADLEQRPRGTWITQRSAFLDQLYAGIDPGAMHTGKRLSELEQQQHQQQDDEEEEQEAGAITLTFEDGTRHVCDVLLGADGIHSATRRYVLGAEHAELADPVFAGWWTVWQLAAHDEAVKRLGRELVDPQHPRQYMWIGPEGAVMHDLLSDNTLVQCVIVQRVPEEEGADGAPSAGEWKKTVTRDELRRHLDGWDERLRGGMVDLVAAAAAVAGEEIPMISLWHHRKPCPAIVRGAVGVIGDAAGATTPWQGSGGGMAMEDALLLSELFAHVRTPREAEAALRAYDHVNRPRRQRIIESSYEAGLLQTGCHEDAGVHGERLRELLRGKWDFILDVDLIKNRDDALEFMRKALE